MTHGADVRVKTEERGMGDVARDERERGVYLA